MTRIVPLFAFALVACGSHRPQPRAELYSYRISPGTKDEVLIREVERRGDTSVVDVFVHRFGGALGGSMFQAACFADMARRRGKTHFVQLSSEMTRKGDSANPGNDARVVMAFSDGDAKEHLAEFDLPDGAHVFEASKIIDTWSKMTSSSIEERRSRTEDSSK